jgi:hypothetical protein
LAVIAAIALWPVGLAYGAKPTPTPTPNPTPTREQPALDAAMRWLAIVDADQYGDSWDGAAELFKKSVTRSLWIAALTKVRLPLGKLLSRKLRAAVYLTDMPGAPTGEYVVIEFDSGFAGGNAMIERITPMKDPDGVWRVSGYYVVPAT